MMKKMYSVLAIAGLFLFSTTSFAAASAHPAAAKEVALTAIGDGASATEAATAKSMENEWKNLTVKEKREKRKAVKQAVKSAKENGSDTELLLLVILAILLPPLAMALYDGISTRFWISLILTILGFLPGVIYTLIVILGDN